MWYMSDRQEELRTCYDRQAVHFVETRKKNWPELDYMVSYIDAFLSERPLSHIVELWAGGGRWYTAIKPFLREHTTYTGIDFSEGMIEQAKIHEPHATWLVDDMVRYVRQQPQESIDIVVGIASVQHIKWTHARSLFFADVYKALTRWGMMILTNRAYSERFLKKYWKQIMMTIPRCLWQRDASRNDVTIPRKDHQDPTQQHMRYYHLFTLYELRQLAVQSWFLVRECRYINQQGDLTTNRTQARNSFLVVQKDLE